MRFKLYVYLVFFLAGNFVLAVVLAVVLMDDLVGALAFGLVTGLGADLVTGLGADLVAGLLIGLGADLATGLAFTLIGMSEISSSEK
jgi:hypothetical protein